MNREIFAKRAEELVAQMTIEERASQLTYNSPEIKHLNVPAYKTNMWGDGALEKVTMVKDLWNDAGAGPWAQDDANPEYVGYCLAGLNIPVTDKYVVPVGSFASYNLEGNVVLKNEPLIENPFFRSGNSEIDTIKHGETYNKYKVNETEVIVGTHAENEVMSDESGALIGNARVLESKDKPVIYKFDVKDVKNGVGLDFDIIGNGYQIDISADGKNWFRKYDTKNTTPRLTSIDVSNFIGNKDEYVQSLRFFGDDEKFIKSDSGSKVELRSKYIDKDKSVVYEIDLNNMTSAFAEVIVGNNYAIELSGDNENWQSAIDCNYYGSGKESVDGEWFRILNFDDFVEYGKVYVKISNLAFEDQINSLVKYKGNAFFERLTLYSVFDTDNLFVRIFNTEDSIPKKFELKQITMRTW